MSSPYFDVTNLPDYDRNEYGMGQFEFDPDRDLAISPGWIYIPTWSNPPLTPFGAWYTHTLAGPWLAYGAAHASYPRLRATVPRSLRGGLYFAILPIEDPEEIRQREGQFREFMRANVVDFQGCYRRECEAADRVLDPLKDVQRQGLDKLSDAELLTHFHRWKYVCGEVNRIHFQIAHPTAAVVTLFLQQCEAFLGIDEASSLYQRLMQGFPNKYLDGDAEMERLATRAVELGFEDLFLRHPAAAEIVAEIGASTEGQTWLGELAAFQDEYGWNVRRPLEFVNPSWFEDPSGIFLAVHNFVLGGKGETLAAARLAAEEDRTNAEAEVLARIPEAKRQEFAVLMRSAQAAEVAANEHEFYTDLPMYATGRHAVAEIGKRCAKYGMIDDPDDIFYVTGFEIPMVFLPRSDLRETVAKRKDLRKAYEAEQPKLPVIGTATPEQTFGRVFQAGDMTMLRIAVGTMPRPNPEQKADVWGVPASGGTVEGTARVVVHADALEEIQRGEILVCASTFPAWTWAFSLIAGAVADSGGTLCHTAVVAREYRIPAVVNARGATSLIKTGQRIRVDGGTGAVTILE